MEYKKQKFTKGQVLTHDHLNHMEDGIANATNRAMSGEYTLVPTLGSDGILYFVTSTVTANENSSN